MNTGPGVRSSRYQARLSSFWWLSSGRYCLFMLRELSAVFVALYVGTYVIGLYRLSLGKASYEGYVLLLQEPTVLIVLGVALLFCLLHTLTWIHLTPIVMVVRMGRKVIPSKVILIANYLIWSLLSGIFCYLMVN